jgi:hypothetical protein
MVAVAARTQNDCGWGAARRQRRHSLTISFADQVIAFLAVTSNQAQLATLTGLADFATTSFTNKYGQGGFQVNSVTLGTASNFRFQQPFNCEGRLSGFRERRSEQPPRDWYQLKMSREAPTWVDVALTVPVDLAVQAVPGSIQLGPSGGLTQSGITDPAPTIHDFQFQLAVTTTVQTLSYQANCLVFAAADPAPVNDLRRITAVRRTLEEDGTYLVSLDGTTDQKPLLFVQLYPAGVLPATPLSETAVVAAFGAADVLAAFLTVPNM